MQLEKLCKDLLIEKERESECQRRRIAIEQQIIAIVGHTEEGAKTVDATGYKVRIDNKINRKLDEKKWALVKDQIPEPVRPVSIVEEYKIDTKGVHWLRDNEPGYYRLMCEAMEEKAAKPNVRVEEV